MRMPKYRSQRVPYFEHPRVEAARQLNWEDIRVFLAVARNRSFRAASTQLGLSFNTVRRHVERLEHQTGALLIVRHPNGTGLTPEGQLILATARNMEAAALEVERAGGQTTTGMAGRVRISITEGLGTFWLVPRLVRFQRSHPNIILEANCTFREPDVVRMEADISIQLTEPAHADVKAVRLGWMHAIPFAAPEYLQTFGVPKTLRDIENHKVVEQISPQLDTAAIDRLFPGKDREGFVSIATNTSTAHFWAVVRGAGLGMLPTYLACLGARVVPLDIGLRVRHGIWLAYHPDSRRVRRVAQAVKWIKENFEPEKFPWFASEFIHPTNIQISDPALIRENHFRNIVAL